MSKRLMPAMSGAALAACLMAVPVLAQAPAAKPATPAQPAQAVQPAIPTEPSVTTAAFGDWTLRCQRLSDDAKATKVCEVAQVMQAQGQQVPIAQIAIGRLAAGDPLRITAALPLSVAFPSAVQIVLGEGKLDLPWRRCLPTGCFAESAATDAALQQWRKATETGRIVFRDAADRDIALPFSARGLDQALDALAKEKL